MRRSEQDVPTGTEPLVPSLRPLRRTQTSDSFVKGVWGAGHQSLRTLTMLPHLSLFLPHQLAAMIVSMYLYCNLK